MREFTQVKADNRGLSDGSYYFFEKQQKMINDKTETARRWFKTPAYCIGDRRKEFEQENQMRDISRQHAEL